MSRSLLGLESILTTRLLTAYYYYRPQNETFIALIHPVCTRQVACSTSLLSRQCDVIASFSFGACTVQTNFIW